MKTTPDIPQLLNDITETLHAKKGQDVVIIDVSAVSSITDYYVIVSGTSTPHIKALAEELVFELKKKGMPCFGRTGKPESEWVVIDYVEAVVHIFSPTARTHFALEQLWSDAPQIRVESD